jgi:hypothetical protein
VIIGFIIGFGRTGVTVGIGVGRTGVIVGIIGAGEMGVFISAIGLTVVGLGTLVIVGVSVGSKRDGVIGLIGTTGVEETGLSEDGVADEVSDTHAPFSCLYPISQRVIRDGTPIVVTALLQVTGTLRVSTPFSTGELWVTFMLAR